MYVKPDLTTLRDIARAPEHDRLIAATLSPRVRQTDLIIAAAATSEITRVVRLVSEPMIGAIRLQWWREAVAAPASAAAREARSATGHPVADALGDLLDRCPGALSHFDAMLEAAEAEITARLSSDPATALLRAGQREQAAFALAAAVMGLQGAAHHDLFAAAGRAYACARAVAGPFPPAAPSYNQLANSAREELAIVRSLLGRAPRAVFDALLPLALVEPYLHAFHFGSGIRAGAGGVDAMARVWHLWWARRTGRF